MMRLECAQRSRIPSQWALALSIGVSIILLGTIRQTVVAWVPVVSRVRNTISSQSSTRLFQSTIPSEATSILPETVTSEEDGASSKKKKWFVTKPEDGLDYHQTVSRAYVRHVQLETLEACQLALQLYLNSTSSLSQTNRDPFGQLARDLSACEITKKDGGTVGWIDNPNYPNASISTDSSTLSPHVVNTLFAQRPKGASVYTLEDIDASSTQGARWHLIQVVDLQVVHEFATSKRPKLKGKGITPVPPLSLDKYWIQTTGCQMNVADSERLEGVLQSRGMTSAESSDQADLILFNTCTIRDHAEQKLYDALGPHVRLKESGKKNVVLAVAGCVAQQEGRELIKRIPALDLVLGPQYVPRISTLLDQYLENGQQLVATDPTLYTEGSNPTMEYNGGSETQVNAPKRESEITAWVNIIYGCNEHCTYCVVPNVRGMEQSRSMESILMEVLDLQKRGYKEVTLLGQNIDAYGRDQTPKRTFAQLLQYLDSHVRNEDTGDSNFRIRYVTSHPRYFSDKVIDAVANLPSVMECFHVPFQSGDDGVLRDMRRGYTHDSYMHIIQKIRKAAPDASICGDVIVGFPGETEEAFERTLELMRKVKFDNLNTFAYSPRPNTEAALWENKIPEDVKADRLQRVQRLAVQHAMERSERYAGRVVEVLVEGVNPRRPLHSVVGKTRQGRAVFFDGDIQELEGQFCQVHIDEASTWSLMGTHVPNPSDA